MDKTDERIAHDMARIHAGLAPRVADSGLTDLIEQVAKDVFREQRHALHVPAGTRKVATDVPLPYDADQINLMYPRSTTSRLPPDNNLLFKTDPDSVEQQLRENRLRLTPLGKQVTDALKTQSPEKVRAFFAAIDNWYSLLRTYFPGTHTDDEMIRATSPEFQVFSDPALFTARVRTTRGPLPQGWHYFCEKCATYHPETHRHVTRAVRVVKIIRAEEEFEQETAVARSGGMYSSALEHQMELLRRLKTIGFEQMIKAGTPRVYGMLDARGVELFLRECLFTASPYYWNPETARLLSETYRSMPDTTLTPPDLPTPSGFCYLSRPILVNTPTGANQELLINDIHGMAWYDCTSMVNEIERDHPGEEHRKPGAFAFFLSIVEGKIVPSGTFYWEYGEHLSNIRVRLARQFAREPELPHGDKLSDCCQLFAAMLAFLNQKILTVARGRPDRATRKRAEPHVQHVPLVKVVYLRATERRHGESAADHAARDYQCRWEVRRHWRQQRVGRGRLDTRPTLIHPYVKGPANKPLRTSARIFAVTR